MTVVMFIKFIRYKREFQETDRFNKLVLLRHANYRNLFICYSFFGDTAIENFKLNERNTSLKFER